MRYRSLVRNLACFALIAGWTAVAAAAVKLPAIFGDDMVLQRGRPVPVWGWADKGEKVTVSIAGQTLTTKADQQGRLFFFSFYARQMRKRVNSRS